MTPGNARRERGLDARSIPVSRWSNSKTRVGTLLFRFQKGRAGTVFIDRPARIINYRSMDITPVLARAPLYFPRPIWFTTQQLPVPEINHGRFRPGRGQSLVISVSLITIRSLLELAAKESNKLQLDQARLRGGETWLYNVRGSFGLIRSFRVHYRVTATVLSTDINHYRNVTRTAVDWLAEQELLSSLLSISLSL